MQRLQTIEFNGEPCSGLERRNICEFFESCPLKDKLIRDLVISKASRTARLEAFLEGLAHITLLDWGAVADKLKNQIKISPEAIASGLNIVNRFAMIGAIDSQIRAAMESERKDRDKINLGR